MGIDLDSQPETVTAPVTETTTTTPETTAPEVKTEPAVATLPEETAIPPAINYEEAYKNLHPEFTRVTQENAELKKKIPAEQSPVESPLPTDPIEKMELQASQSEEYILLAKEALRSGFDTDGTPLTPETREIINNNILDCEIWLGKNKGEYQKLLKQRNEENWRQMNFVSSLETLKKEFPPEVAAKADKLLIENINNPDFLVRSVFELCKLQSNPQTAPVFEGGGKAIQTQETPANKVWQEMQTAHKGGIDLGF